MTPRQIELARHSLGLDGRRKTSYRNYFCVGAGAPDYDEWQKLCQQKLAVRRSGKTKSGTQLFGGDDIFHLTRDGAMAALKGNEKLDPDDFPALPAAEAQK